MMEEQGKETVRRSVLDSLPRELVDEILGHLTAGSSDRRRLHSWHRGVSPQVLCQLIRCGGQLGELGVSAARHVEIAEHGCESEHSFRMSSDVPECAMYMPTLGPHVRKLTYSAWGVQARSLTSFVASFCPAVEHVVITDRGDAKHHQYRTPANANQVYRLVYRLDQVRIIELRNLVVDSDMVDAAVFSCENACMGELRIANLNLLVPLDSLWSRLARNVQIVRLEGKMRIDGLALDSLADCDNDDVKEISFRNVQGVDGAFVNVWKSQVAVNTRIVLYSKHGTVRTKGSTRRCE